MSKKLLSIVTPTFNEIQNIEPFINKIRAVITPLEKYNFEIIVIDNCSNDGTKEKIRELVALDKRIKAIFNIRNFGHIRSPYYGILQSNGDATIYLASDFQDPPEYIPEFIKEWERGWLLVMAVKPVSKCNKLMHLARKCYYVLIDSISDIEIIKNSTGFGLYDKKILQHLKKINDPYPFLRGLICELGYPIKTIEFTQPERIKGITKNNFYTLFDIAMLGLISHSKVPIRIASLSGFIMGVMCIILSIFFLFMKLIYWNAFPLGSAPAIIISFFVLGTILFFIGIIGEYIGSIHTYLQNRPVVIEDERLNFQPKEESN
jgi:glycosyltransferase involved in cell wall biosynthesis